MVESGKYILGPEVAAFEEEFAAYLGVRHCVGVANGTDALAIALRALGVGPGRRGGDAVAHLLRHRRGGGRRGRGAGVLRRRPRHRLRDARRPCARRSRRGRRPSCRCTCSATSRRCAELRELGLPVLEDAAQAAGATLDGTSRRARWPTPPPSRSSPPRTCPAWATGARSSPTATRWPSRRASCASTARATRSPSRRWATTRASTSCRPPRCGCCCPSSTAGREARQAAAAEYERRGLGEHVTLPAARRGRRPRLPPLRGPPPAGGRAGGARWASGGCPRAATTACRSTASRRWRASAPGRRPPGHRGAGRAPTWRCRWAPAWTAEAVGEVVDGVRVWVDLTNSPHVLVMRPLIEAMREDGHDVEVTARDFAQTLELCERLGVDHTADRPPRRQGPGAQPRCARSGALARWARPARLRRGHGPRLQRRDGGRGAAADPQRHRLRLRVGKRPAPGQLPPGARRGRCPRRSRPSGWTATGPRASCAATRA